MTGKKMNGSPDAKSATKMQNYERNRIIGILEYLRDEMGDSSYETYAKKVLNRAIRTIEHNL
jgi:hypothetical protein